MSTTRLPVPAVYTVGYRGKSLEEFISLLRGASVDAVIDVRLRNTSHLAGYTKRDDLDFLLREGFGIAYEHHLELAPSPEILDTYRADNNWSVYEAAFQPLLAQRAAEQVGRDILDRYRAPCLLCSEPTADTCHRRLIAEYWAEHMPRLVIAHL